MLELTTGQTGRKTWKNWDRKKNRLLTPLRPAWRRFSRVIHPKITFSFHTPRCSPDTRATNCEWQKKKTIWTMRRRRRRRRRWWRWLFVCKEKEVEEVAKRFRRLNKRWWRRSNWGSDLGKSEKKSLAKSHTSGDVHEQRCSFDDVFFLLSLCSPCLLFKYPSLCRWFILSFQTRYCDTLHFLISSLARCLTFLAVHLIFTNF